MLPTDAQVVVMCGVSGSGKTFIARRFESQGYLRISADDIVWRRYGSRTASLPQEQLARAYADAGVAILTEIDHQLSLNHQLVIDATMCRRFKRDEVAEICRRHGASYKIVYMDTPETTIAKRLEGRSGCGPDDQTVTKEQLKMYLSHFEKPQPDENHITITES